MPNFPSLTRNPIIQAIIEIQIEFPANFDIKSIKEIFKILVKDYPNQKERLKIEGQIEIKDKVSSLKYKNDGYLFSDKTNHKSFLVTPIQFSFFQSHPYDTWDNFKNEAIKVWHALNQVVKPEQIKRVSTRFINRINIPIGDKLKFDDYFYTHIQISEKLNPNVIDCSFKYSVVDVDTNTFSNIVFSIEKISEGIAPFLFDIDILTTNMIEINNIDNIFEILHEKKNEIFFGTITEKTYKLLE